MLTLVASALAGGDCIDDADALRAGRTSSVLGCTVKAPSTLGDVSCAASGGGHVRQLDRVSRELLARAWAAGAGPGNGPLTIDLAYGLAKEGGATPWLHWQARLSPAAGRGRRNRRRADVPAARGPRQHRSGRRPLPAGDRGTGAPCWGLRGKLTVRGRQRLLHHRRPHQALGYPVRRRRSFIVRRSPLPVPSWPFASYSYHGFKRS